MLELITSNAGECGHPTIIYTYLTFVNAMKSCMIFSLITSSFVGELSDLFLLFINVVGIR